MAKKTIAAGVPVAARPIAIEGKHFDEGEPVTGVSDEQLAIAKRLGRVIDAPQRKKATKPVAAAASDTGDDDAAGDNAADAEPGE